jgi:hypothetical protein
MCDFRKLLAFDLEISKVIPDGAELDACRPLGISCLAVYPEDCEPVAYAEKPAPGGNVFGEKLHPASVVAIIDHLEQAVRDGYMIVGWNSLKFDFSVLAEESGERERCAALAMGSWDVMFQFFCQQGYFVGLDATCRGMHILGKPEGMNGSLAPVMWGQGRKEQESVIAYCINDARITLEAAKKIRTTKQLTWVTKKGSINNIPIPQPVICREAFQIPEPDTSWMTAQPGRELPTRAMFTEWMGK